MAKSNNQKGKILYLERILQNSGENHAVSMQEILETLAERGVTAERKSIYDDMAVLREFGMDIRYRRGKPGGYYLAGRPAGLEAESEGAREAKPQPEAESEDIREAKSQPEAESEGARAAKPRPEAESEGIREAESGSLPEAESEGVREAKSQPEAESEGVQESESKSIGEAAGERKPSWLGGTQGSRSVKLACENSIRPRVEEAIGDHGLYKEKGMTMFTVTAEISETPEFYGWLASMGKRVFIQKPKKTAAAYRDYLKELAREYKGL